MTDLHRRPLGQHSGSLYIFLYLFLGSNRGQPCLLQEPEAGSSSQAEFLPMRRSAPVTTGHGGGMLSGGGWMQAGLAKQFSAGRLGNNRPPIPTCSIPATRTSTAITMVPIESSCMQQASSSKLADGLLGFSGPPVKVENPQSASGSGDSTQDQVYEVQTTP